MHAPSNSPNERENNNEFQLIRKFIRDHNNGVPNFRKRIEIRKQHVGLTIQYQTEGIDSHGIFNITLSNGQSWKVTNTETHEDTTPSRRNGIFTLEQVLSSIGIDIPQEKTDRVQRERSGFGSLIDHLLGRRN